VYRLSNIQAGKDSGQAEKYTSRSGLYCKNQDYTVRTSVVDPDPAPDCIRIQEKPSALKREHPALQKMKFINCFLFFLEVLDVLFWGLKASPVAWTSFMKA
jgi:hypothetical protein